ncbi:MAG: helix-turn-helix transcriptional regulator [Lachnospiraceae bacterium]|nr:helix-turn-helix transcriptional regulator [Lachnospiraceae bacterium]
MEFDKNTLFRNITYLLRKQGKKIGELESEAGVSAGYISRTSKDSTKPGIDFILKAAEALHISIDTLLRVELTNLTPTEDYLISFLKKLEEDTVNDKLDWKCESEGYLNNKIYIDEHGVCSHPLFENVTVSVNDDNTGYPVSLERIAFVSKAFEEETVIDGDCYNVRLKNGALLYIMKISKAHHIMGNRDRVTIEVWMTPKYSIGQYLCSTNDDPIIEMMICNLYTAISESVKHPKVSKDIKTIIDAFMNDDMEDDVPSSDDLPF